MRGGYGSGEHASLGERAARRERPDESQGSPEPDTGPGENPARHCLVEGSPSLLVEWRPGARGWEGRVLSVLWLDDVGWACVERWLPASSIRPR